MITWKYDSWSKVLTRLARSRRLTQAERDAVADAVDRCSTLASEVESLKAIENEYDSRMTAMRVALTGAGIPEGDGNRVFGGVERIEMLTKRADIERTQARKIEQERDDARARADSECAHANKWSQRALTAEAERDELKARVVTCGECRFLGDCEYHKCFNGGREMGPKWCSDGEREVMP
jgi:hypothetical protein